MTTNNKTSKINVVVQARLSSSRLPAKAFLSIGSLPAIQLLAKRIFSKNYTISFALPSNIEGRLIANQLELLNLPSVKFFFGSLENVLSRFMGACKDLGEDDIIVRLTADNLIPDASFIEELISKYKGGYSYASINDSAYGVSAEIFQKKFLTEAYLNAKTKYEIENVTPYLKKKYLRQPIVHKFNPKHNLRLTMDNFQDYLMLYELFSHFDNPEKTSWKKILSKAYSLFPEKKRIMIGTAQFGMNYGITNKNGKVEKKEIYNIINFSNKNSIFAYDTAAEYGDSEKILGQHSNYLSNSIIITKLGKNVKTKTEVQNSILSACYRLNQNILDGILLHKFEQLKTDVWKHLREFKRKGLVKNIGVSVYTPEEAQIVLEEGNSDIIQIPYNILDWRWDGFFKDCSNKIKIFVRSIFLQGAILNDEFLDKKGFCEIGNSLDFFVQKFGLKNRAHLCVSYVKSQKEINYIIIGVDDVCQAKKNVEYYDSPDLSENQLSEIRKTFQNVPEKLLDIRKW